MLKNNIKYLSFIFFLFYLIISLTTSYASESKKFLSLKNNKTNLRQGPSFEYPIKLIYQKKYLPVVISDKSGTWRKIIDFKNNSGWIHISQLSKKKTALNVNKNSILFTNPTIYSKPIAKLAIGRLVIINKCKMKWCKINSGGFTGWVLKESLWGKIN